MIVVKREWVDQDPDDVALTYRYTRDATAEKALQPWIDLKADLDTNGQISPILIDKIYDRDFVLVDTFVTDGWRRWLAVQDDELIWATMNCIVTTWVQNDDSIITQTRAETGLDPYIDFQPEAIYKHTYSGDPLAVDGDTAELTAQKTPAAFPIEATWLTDNPGKDTDDYNAASADYDVYVAIWGDIDTYVTANTVLEFTPSGYRDMRVDGNGDVYYSPVKGLTRYDSLQVVRAEEEGITIPATVHIVDRTGNPVKEII